MSCKFLSIYNKEYNPNIKNLLIEDGFIFDLEYISTTDEKKFDLAKSQNAIFVDSLDKSLKQTLNLHSDLTLLSKDNIDVLICSDAFSNASEGFSTNNTFGRLAYDKIEYSELEIERIARSAFESAQKRNKHLTLVDKSDCLTTSKLFRKIISDINEDYEDVYVDMLNLEDSLVKIIDNISSFDVILSPSLFKDSIVNLIQYKYDIYKEKATASIGDTPLGLYQINNTDESIKLAIKLSRMFSFEN